MTGVARQVVGFLNESLGPKNLIMEDHGKPKALFCINVSDVH
jgi:hypothetical protein